jgi:hypothetical protein
MINVELGRKDHVLIPTIAIERELKPLDTRTDLQTRLTDKNKK